MFMAVILFHESRMLESGHLRNGIRTINDNMKAILASIHIDIRMPIFKDCNEIFSFLIFLVKSCFFAKKYPIEWTIHRKSMLKKETNFRS